MGRLIERIKAMTPVRQILAVQERFGEDGAGLLGNAMAFTAFFSVFPLVLLALSITGFVLAGRPELGDDWRRAITDAVPGLSTLIGDNLDAIVTARAGTGIAGLLGLMWTGTGLVRAGRAALARVFRIEDPSNAVTGILRALRSFVVLGTLAAITIGVGSWAGSAPATGASGIALRTGAILLSLIVDIGFFTAAYWSLSRPRGPAMRRLVPGAILAGIGWTLLKVLGSWYARRTVANAVAVYGTFAASIGLLVILALAARFFMYGAVVNALRIERRPLTVADVAADATRQVG